MYLQSLGGKPFNKLRPQLPEGYYGNSQTADQPDNNSVSQIYYPLSLKEIRYNGYQYGVTYSVGYDWCD